MNKRQQSKCYYWSALGGHRINYTEMNGVLDNAKDDLELVNSVLDNA